MRHPFPVPGGSVAGMGTDLAGLIRVAGACAAHRGDNIETGISVTKHDLHRVIAVIVTFFEVTLLPLTGIALPRCIKKLNTPIIVTA